MHGGNLLEAMERYGKRSFIDLSANINPLGPPKGVWEAINRALPKIVHYPDPEYRRLRRALAQNFNLPEDWILLGNGAGELLFSILQALRPKKVLIPVPAFSEYERAARACGSEINNVTIGLEGWSNPLFQKSENPNFWKELLRGCELLFLNSPHNPTGSFLDKELFECILSQAQEMGTWVILDESFVDFLDDEDRWSGKEYLRDYPNLIVLYSMTKFYAIPGLRLGAVFAASNVLTPIKEHRDPWSVNILAEEAGIAALEDVEYSEQVRWFFRQNKEYFFKAFEQAEFQDYSLMPSSVNFALIKILQSRSAVIVEELGRQGVLVRDCRSFQGLEGEFIRVAIKDPLSMKALIDGLKRSE
jgi:threonine-phosphate decarboxylase